ncbi:complement C3-like [Menidia menidia]
MGSDGRMSWIQLLLAALAAICSLSSIASGAQQEVMSAPNLLRVGTWENIFVEIQDCTLQGNIDVQIFVKNHPSKSKIITSTTATLTKANKYQFLARVKIPTGELSKDPNVKQFVVLQAQFPGRLLEKVLLVSFQYGFIFIQTDKTIYTPTQDVRYRIFALRPNMEPVEKGSEKDTESSVLIEIMTPDGIVVQSDSSSLTSGMKSSIYTLEDIVSFGMWKVTAKFQNSPQQTFFAEFEVKEYVLPSFEVKLSVVGDPFFYVDSNELTINIKSTYVFGKKVDGTAYVVFGVYSNNAKKGFPDSLQTVRLSRGEGTATLRKADILKTFKNINELVGSSIYVAVSLLTQTGSEMVEAELRGIEMVTSPYKIFFKRTAKFFKPGMSFDVMVEVLNPDGTPANNVPVVVNPGGIKSSTNANGLAKATINPKDKSRLTVTAATTKPGLVPATRQASASMVAEPYQSQSESYLHISVDTVEVDIGQFFRVTFFLNRPEPSKSDLTYLILSRGQVVGNFRFENNALNQISQMVEFTKDMLPSFRIVGYYHKASGEVVSDSVWVDVKDTCMGMLKLEVVGPAPSYEPRRTFKLKVTGDPGATVGLVAVDKSIYILNNKNRLTQKKIWDTVEKYDPACTAGGGANNMKVFYDAGLMLKSPNSETPDRTGTECSTTRRRRKRASTIWDVRTSLLSEFKEKEEQECCLDGMREVPVSYDCKRRSEYIDNNEKCTKAFLRCCDEMSKIQEDNKKELLQLARSEHEDNYMDRNDIQSRTNFPESWHWTNVKLTCPPTDANCKVASAEQYVPLPDTITTWEMTGIGLSNTHSICVADPLEVVVWKPFFIDLKLPYSAVRGEQVEIRAILHNYNIETITVRVELKEDDGACSSAYKKGWFSQEVQVGPETTRAVAFIIIPMRTGSIPIEVKAAVKNSYFSDGIEKNLRVVPPGVLVKTPFDVILEPSKKGGKQVETINSGLKITDLVPNSPTSTLVSLTGIEQLNTLFEDSISGQFMGSLIQEPTGCGEQNMIGMTLPVIATLYLDKTNQWQDVGFEKRDKALGHIKSGYNKELAYRKTDGSFCIFQSWKSTTWLTAYVAKVFSMAYNLVVLDSGVICDAIKFLILNTQQPDGMFVEIGRVYEQHMIGDVGGVDSDASMTAFCLIAMQESETLCSSSVNSLANSKTKAIAYLERRLPRLSNPYAVAMTSYALANENKLNKEILYNFASPDRSHWPVPKGLIYSLEATAYALLALVKAQDFEKAQPVVRWLSRQQKVGGGYGSTQATIMVYQAVAEYWTHAKEPPYSLDVDILLPGKSLVDKYKINNQNHYQARTSKFQGINKDIELTASGTGEAVFKMVSLYYAMPANQEKGCEKFDLNLQLLEEKISESEQIYKLKIEVLFKDKDRDASMTILDIGLPTGYIFNKEDLEALSKGHAPIISSYETNQVLSEKESLMIYLKSVSHTRTEEISFRIEQKMKVGVLQPAAVSVYEYYNRKHCVKFYRPDRRSGEILRLCTKEECVCAEENCTKQKKEKISNDDRTKKACESTKTSKIDFIYKVSVEHFKDNLDTDIFSMRILEAIKVGTSDPAPQGQLRAFLSYQHCRTALDLKTGKTYLIMGSSADIRKDEDSTMYLLGENTWVEYWPTSQECKIPDSEFRPVCTGMEELVNQFEIFGCQMKRK